MAPNPQRNTVIQEGVKNKPEATNPAASAAISSPTSSSAETPADEDEVNDTAAVVEPSEGSPVKSPRKKKKPDGISEREKVRICVQVLKEAAYGPSEIHQILRGKYCRNSIKQWYNRESFRRAPRKEMEPRTLTEEVKVKIKELFDNHPGYGLRLIAKGVNEYLLLKALESGEKPQTISSTTIGRYMNSTTWGKTATRMLRQGSKKNTESYRLFGK